MQYTALCAIGRNCCIVIAALVHIWCCWCWCCCLVDTRNLCTAKEDQGDVYYYLHKKLDDNYDVISALERQLMVETADREKAETEYARQIEELEIRKDDELGPLKQKLNAEEEQVIPYTSCANYYIQLSTRVRKIKKIGYVRTTLCVLGFVYHVTRRVTHTFSSGIEGTLE